MEDYEERGDKVEQKVDEKVEKNDPQKGQRTTEQTDATKQRDQVEKAQKKATQERPSVKDEGGDWEGVKKRPKQNKINSTEKSKQNEKNQLKKY